MLTNQFYNKNHKLTVLLIEDDIIDRMAFERFVECNQINYKLVIGKSISEAKKILNNTKCDIIIVDYKLGDGTGFEIIDMVKETPIIFVTGGGDEEIAIKAMKKGAYDYIIKDPECNYLKILPITVQKAIEDKQKLNQLRMLSQAIMSTSDNVYITNMNNEFVFANSAFNNNYGYSTEEIIDRSEQLIWENSTFPWKDSNIRGEYINKKKNNSNFPVDVTKSIIKSEDGDDFAIVTVTKDISERKKAFEEIKKVTEELEVLNKNKDKFFSIIAHDLRGPFGGLISYSDLIVNDFDKMTQEEIREYFENINKVAKDIFALLENLLDWSRIQTGRMEYQPEEISLNKLTEQVYDLFKISSQNKNIRLVLNNLTACKVNIDKNMIYTVIRNLVSNAIKFTPQNGTVKINLFEESENVVVEVEDNGVGIDQGDIEKLFQIETNHTTIGTCNEKGTGLGLVLCKELVEKNSGKIRVESKVNEGSKFVFSIPKNFNMS